MTRSNYSADTWGSFALQLQRDYSVTLYQHVHEVDEGSLNIIWLPLLDTTTFGLLSNMGVCYRTPKLPGLPLHAPHSTTSPGPSVWRHTESRGIKSHEWVEVTHTATTHPQMEDRQGALPWFYVARG